MLSSRRKVPCLDKGFDKGVGLIAVEGLTREQVSGGASVGRLTGEVSLAA